MGSHRARRNGQAGQALHLHGLGQVVFVQKFEHGRAKPAAHDAVFERDKSSGPAREAQKASFIERLGPARETTSAADTVLVSQCTGRVKRNAGERTISEDAQVVSRSRVSIRQRDRCGASDRTSLVPRG
jgi:hypothetical protein